MPKFTVRIVLHEATPSHYTALYEKLEKDGFLDYIQITDGKYQLPPAEYNYSAKEVTQSQVLEKAKIASRSIVKKYSILVTQSECRTWFGLDKLEEMSDD